mmetsp:Transcript_67741/g.161693  ORF Transcript_67741/g.161693 Transcript_67741/m.161693 type:complete len:513 (-) Transcript_67741:388-1926(-)
MVCCRTLTRGSVVVHARTRHERDVRWVVHLASDDLPEVQSVLRPVQLGHARLDGDFPDGDRHVERHVADLAHLGVHAPRITVLLGERVDHRDGRLVQHVIRDLLDVEDGRGEADAREQEHVVALGRVLDGAVFHRDLAEGGAGGEDCLALCPLEGVLGSDFGLGRGVREREDEWPLVVHQHLLAHLLGEDSGGGRKAEEKGGLELLDHLHEAHAFFQVAPAEARLLVVERGRAGFGEGPNVVHQHEVRVRLVGSEALLHHALREHHRHSAPSAASAGDEDALVRESLRRLALAHEPAHDASEGDRASALDVVVEAAHRVASLRTRRAEIVAVVPQDLVGHVRREVLKLDEDVGEAVADSIHELIDQLEIRLTLDAGGEDASVERVLLQLLVVRPEIKLHREHAVGGDAARGAVERQLPDRDSHAVGAEVSESQDPRAVRHHNNLDTRLGPVCDDGVHVPLVLRRDVHPARPPETVPELLAGLPDRRRVDDGREVLHVVDEQRVEQRLVVVLD